MVLWNKWNKTPGCWIIRKLSTLLHTGQHHNSPSLIIVQQQQAPKCFTPNVTIISKTMVIDP